MISKGTKIFIKYKNFSDKDLMYITSLVNKEFNVELEKIVGKPKEGNLHAPLEITEVQTGQSISIDFTPNLELIYAYLILRVGEFAIENLRKVAGDKLQEILKDAIDMAVRKFKNRRRKDNLEDFSYL